MLQIQGFEVRERIYEGTTSLVYRALQESSQQPVIVKCLKESAAGEDLLSKLNHEYDLGHRVQHPNVGGPVAVEPYGQSPYLVFADTGGQSLKQIIREHNFSIEESLSIIVKIVEGLEAIHQQHIIHKDINPSNIVYNLQTNELKIIDFGISTDLSQEFGGDLKKEVAIGSLPYISPEQTGRMNRGIDYRTDFYSLGITFYELLSGELPFKSKDPLELIHCHIAKMATPLIELNPEVPSVLSDLVMKLMEKNAEDRYQSAVGILEDVRHCLSQMQQNKKIIPFPIAKKDCPIEFSPSARLYGREEELQVLNESFEEAFRGGSELLLVSGYSGVGKSTLINELLKPVALKNGHFAPGKFDQFQRNVPYHAFIQCFKSLIKQIQGESDEQLQAWRQNIQETVGVNGQIMVDVVPELEAIIGTQAKTPTLSAVETKNRVNFTMLNFIRLFCTPDHPLVLFLDDLQWIDLDSLQLIEQLLLESGSSNLLILGAYRSNEVEDDAPLIALLNALEENQFAYKKIELKPLSVASVEQLIADSLHSSRDQVSDLALLVYSKTQGNPFFTIELLKSLYEEKLIWFSRDTRQLCWDFERISQLNISENILDLMAKKLALFSVEEHKVLKYAACLGSLVELSTLAMLMNKTLRDTALVIRGLVNHGVLNAVGESYLSENLQLDSIESQVHIEYLFAHDKIQQAVYDVIDEQRKKEIHLTIGRLIKRSPSHDNEQFLFEIVNHYNASYELLEEDDERHQVAFMNLQAAKKAKNSAAFSAAYDYSTQGIQLYGANAWNAHYRELLELYVVAIDAAYLSGHEDEMQFLMEVATKHVTCKKDMTPIYYSQLMYEISRNELNLALDKGIAITNEYGKLMPHGFGLKGKPNLVRAFWALLQINFKMRGKPASCIRTLPRTDDPLIAAQSQVGVLSGWTALWVKPYYIPMMLKQGLDVLFRYGYTKDAPFLIASYCIILNSVYEKYDLSLEFSKEARKMLDELDLPEVRPATEAVLEIFVTPWFSHIKDTLRPLMKAHQEAKEYGDLLYSSQALILHEIHSIQIGTPLPVLMKQFDQHGKIFDKQNLSTLKMMHERTVEFVESFLGAEGEGLISAATNEKQAARIAEMKAVDDGMGLLIEFILCAFAHSLVGDPEEAERYGFGVNRYIQRGLGTGAVGLGVFVSAFTTLQRLKHQSWLKRAKTLFFAGLNINRLRRWSKQAPMNFAYTYRFLLAELYLALGFKRATSYEYERAISLAKQYGYTQFAAHAAERAAIFHEGQGNIYSARKLMADAYNGFQKWGAEVKLKQLRRDYSHLLVEHSDSIEVTSTWRTFDDKSIDILTLRKSLKEIAEKNVHTQIIEATLEAAIEFANAERGVLLLRKKHGELQVEAEYDCKRSNPLVIQASELNGYEGISHLVVNFVRRAKQSVVIENAQEMQDVLPRLSSEKYVIEHGVKSIHCLPIIAGVDKESELLGLLYLENNITLGCFTSNRVQTLEIICMAAAGRLELAKKATMDGLTSLYNHDFFQTVLSKRFSEAARSDKELSVILIDIDHFKKFNDNWGHQAGDVVLKAVAHLIKRNCRDSDIVARYGGEEMAVILPDTNPSIAFAVAEKLREAVAGNSVDYKGERLKVTISLGVANYRIGVETPEILIKEADMALYRSKGLGRNKTTLAS